MTDNMNRNRSQRLAISFLIALIGGASLASQPFLDSSSGAAAPLDQPIRITLVRKFMDTLPAEAKDLEVNFTGANGAVTGVSATNGKQTIRFERADDAELSCPRGKVKECESLSLTAGGKLTVCACLPPAPVTQTREHILLAKQVGVPALMQKNSQPTALVSVPVSADRTYEVELSDKTMLRATAGGGQTCWLNRKARVRICY